MTVREVLTAMVRHWYLSLAAVVVMVALAVVLVGEGGSYSTRTVVSFMFPTTSSLSDSNGTDDESLVTFAGVVAHEINNGRAALRYSEDEAPFYGAGVREGVLVGLPYMGNQWAANYTRAEIEIQVVGRTYEWVHEQQTELVDRVLDIASREQEALSASDEHIEVSVVPLTLQIEQITASRTAIIAAVSAFVAAALIIAGWLSVMLDNRRSNRRGSIALPPRTPVLRGAEQ